MTTNSPNQPNHSPQQNGYKPITLEDVQKPHQSRTQLLFAELNTPILRWIAAPLLGFIFLFCERNPEAAPLTILVLLGCLFTRLEGYPRQIAAAPLTLAAIKLSAQMASHFNLFSVGPSSTGDIAADGGFCWLPMFFSICLVYMPKRESVTFKLVLVSSCLLLLSGLLPMMGFVVIFNLLGYTLFMAMSASIAIDLKDPLSGGFQSSPRPAH